METLIRHAILYAVAAIAAASAPQLYATDPDIETVKASLEARLRFYQHEERISALESLVKKGGDPYSVTPHDAVAGADGNDAGGTVPVPDSRPVLECLVADGDWCTYCNWWKERGDDGLPFRLVFVETKSQPVYGWPTFRIPHTHDGREWFIGNSACSESGVSQVVAKWRKIVGETTDQPDKQDAAQSPTPRAEILKALSLARFKHGETFADIGSGDGRALILAAEAGASRATGVEIDPAQVSLSRRRIAESMVENVAKVIEADATKIELPKADVAFVYLYSDLLAELKDELTAKYDRVVSYQHRIPGLSMRKHGDLWLWTKPQPVARTYTANRGAVWGGRVYNGPVCNSRSCRMCASIRAQLYGR